MLVNLADTPANRAMFGCTGTAEQDGEGAAPFPQIRIVALTARAGRAMLGAIPGSSRAGEQTLLKRLARRRPELFTGRVTCFDRNFPGHELITAILDAGGHLVARVSATVALPLEPGGGWLPDGSRSGAGGLPVSGCTQPAITAIMLQQLEVRPGQRVLEIGAGTGYNAALLAHLVGATGRVVTVDLDEDIVVEARRRLAACGFERVTVCCGDGGFGWPLEAPYDRIILTAGAWDVAPAWVDQLAPAGRLLLPLSLCRWVQYSIAFDPSAIT